MSARLAVVTATIDFPRAEPFIRSWVELAAKPIDVYIVGQGQTNRDWEVIARYNNATMYGFHHREILGVVPAFARGVEQALHDGAPIIAALHDDLEIEQEGWDEEVVRLFKACPRAGLCGFGGARGLGEEFIYQRPYDPMQLVRKQFGSNMRHAEAHGERWTAAQPVACLDGFSQIGLRGFWQGLNHTTVAHEGADTKPGQNLFKVMETVGMVHHAYDAALGCFAKALGYQVWYVPVACHHHGGLTAVADPRYHEWANEFKLVNAVNGMEAQGDNAYWIQSHKIVYEMFRNVLPIRT